MLRLSIAVFLSLLLAAWSIVMLPEVVRGFTTDCASAASEVSDPCAWGRGVWVAGNLGLWVVGFAIIAFGLFRVWRR